MIAFEQGDLTIGKILFACNTWLQEVQSAGRITVDLSLIRGADVPATVGARDEELGIIESLDGRVVHRFNMSVVRADVPASAVPKLVGYWGEPHQRIANHARAVPRWDRVDLEVSVGYRGDPQPVIEHFVVLGGVVTERLDISEAFHGVISDSAIPEFLDGGGVRFIQQNDVACMQR